jgi:uncharacterized protein
MLVRMHHDPVAFLELVEPFLMARQVECSLPLGIARAFADQRSHEGLMFSVESGPDVVAVAVKSPRRHIVLTTGPDNAMIALARFLFEYGLPVPGAIGPVKSTQALIDEWILLNGCTAHLRMNMRLYCATAVRAVTTPAGTFRLARLGDIDAIEMMTLKFIAEATHDPTDDVRKRCLESIGAGLMGVWEEAGSIVSMTETVNRTEQISHIRCVYTPPAFRGRGFATALVARMTSRQLSSGRTFCTLYTDLSNPTSNKIYQQVGYEPVMDSIDVAFA